MVHVIRKPSNPTSAPSETAMHWVNTLTGAVYFSKGTATLGDWVLQETSDEIVGATDGIIEGGLVTINADTTKFDVAAGSGKIIDFWSDPENPIVQTVTWSAQTGISPTYISSFTESFLAIDDTGAVSQFSSYPSNESRRDYIMLAKLGHTGLTTINSVTSLVECSLSPIAQTRDLVRAIGFIKSGNAITANGANLSLNKSAGTIYSTGLNFFTSNRNPNQSSQLSATAFTFQYRTRTGVSSANTTFISPTQYDVAGTVTTMPAGANTATNQRVYVNPSGVVRIQYGQQIYTTLALAVAGINAEQFVTYENISSSFSLIAIVSVTRGATALNNATTCTITNIGKFGETGSAGGGGGGGVTDHTGLTNIGVNTHAQIDTHISSTSNPHGTSDANLTTTDITTNNASTTKHGFLKKLSNISTEFMNGQGNWATPSSGGGLTNFTEAVNTSSPNATIPVVSLTATNAASDVDFVIAPKGTGGISASVADNTATGGNKRGAGAVDLQGTSARNTADRVAAGDYSCVIGYRNTGANTGSFAFGNTNYSGGVSSFAMGSSCSANASQAFSMGNNCNANGAYSWSMGNGADSVTVKGRVAYAANSSNTQYSKFNLTADTTNTTSTRLTCDGGAAAFNNQVSLYNENVFAFTGLIAAKTQGSTDCAAWKIEGLIRIGANEASTTLVASTVTAISNIPAYGTPVLSADTTNGSLAVTVSGLSATNVRWSAAIETAEVRY